MALELKQQVRLSQQLVMTPQLQQAIKLLQLNRMELMNLVQQELQDNPALEEADTEEDPTPGELADGTPELGMIEESAAERPGSESAEPEEAAPSDAEKIADVEWEDYIDAYPQTGMESGVAHDDDRPSIEATLTRRPSLAEHLAWQIQLSSCTREEAEVATWIIGNLDEMGYLRTDVDDLVRASGFSAEIVESALSKVQELDPAGVAARNLRECLLIQVKALGIENSLVRRILEDHMALLEKRDLRGLAKVTRCSQEEVADATGVSEMDSAQ